MWVRLDYLVAMDGTAALPILSALAQRTRLDAYLHLRDVHPKGLSSGEIAKTLGTPANTMSSHLLILARAGLITASRDGKTVYYHAEVGMAQRLADFLSAAEAVRHS